MYEADLSESDASALADLADHAHGCQHVRLAQEARQAATSKTRGLPVTSSMTSNGGRLFTFLPAFSAPVNFLLAVFLLGSTSFQTGLENKVCEEENVKDIFHSLYADQGTC